jgi:hypothetical protein
LGMYFPGFLLLCFRWVFGLKFLRLD